MTSPFEYVKALNEKTDVEFSEDYLPFLVNRGMSFHRDTIMFANEMNRYCGLPKQAQFDFYKHGVPKGKRYSKWAKKDEPTDAIELLKNLYCINNQTAMSYLSLLSENDIQQLIESNEKGGSYGHKRNGGS